MKFKEGDPIKVMGGKLIATIDLINDGKYYVTWDNFDGVSPDGWFSHEYIDSEFELAIHERRKRTIGSILDKI